MKHITVKLPKGQEGVNIYPVADVQYGAHGIEVDGFNEYVAEAASDPIGRILGVGDYTDGISPSNRRILLSQFVKGDLYDVARDMLDDAASEQLGGFMSMVENTRGQWDAVIGGHHFWEYQPIDGRISNTDMELADFVGCPYVPEASTAVVSYVFPKEGKFPQQVLRVWATHGQGASASYSGPLNQLEKMMRAFMADVYIVAHHHKLVAARAVKLAENPRRPTQLQATDGLLVSAGSWMRGYMPDEVTYAEKGMLVPLATGAPIVRVTRRIDGTFKIRAEI